MWIALKLENEKHVEIDLQDQDVRPLLVSSALSDIKKRVDSTVREFESHTHGLEKIFFFSPFLLFSTFLCSSHSLQSHLSSMIMILDKDVEQLLEYSSKYRMFNSIEEIVDYHKHRSETFMIRQVML